MPRGKSNDPRPLNSFVQIPTALPTGKARHDRQHKQTLTYAHRPPKHNSSEIVRTNGQLPRQNVDSLME